MTSWDWAFFRLYLYTYSQHCFLLEYKDIYGSGEKGQPALVEDELEKTKNPHSGAEPGAHQPNTNTAISWDLHGNKHSVITKMFPGRIQCVTPYSLPVLIRPLSKDKFE